MSDQHFQLRLTPLLRQPLVALTLIAILAFTPKAVFFGCKGWIGPSADEIRYLNMAASLRSYHELAELPGQPSDRDSPLYPLFLAAFVGSHSPASDNEWTRQHVPYPAIWIQMLLSSISACLAYVIGRRLAGDVSGWLAGLAFAAFVPMMLAPSRFVTETLSLFLLLLVTLNVDFWLKAANKTQAIAYGSISGVLFAVLALSNAVTFPLILVSVGFVLWSRRENPGQTLVSVTIALAAFAVCYSPWIIRSQMTFGEIRILPSKGPGARFIAYHTAKAIDEGHNLDQAREIAFATMGAKLAAGDYDMSVPARITSTEYWKHVWQRLRIMVGAHPCLELPFPFAGHTVYASTPMKWFNYLWSFSLFASILPTLVFAMKQQNWRLLHTIAIPFALIFGYSMVHAIPRYQTLPYAALSVPAGVGLAMLFFAMPALRIGPGNIAVQEVKP